MKELLRRLEEGSQINKAKKREFEKTGEKETSHSISRQAALQRPDEARAAGNRSRPTPKKVRGAKTSGDPIGNLHKTGMAFRQGKGIKITKWGKERKRSLIWKSSERDFDKREAETRAKKDAKIVRKQKIKAGFKMVFGRIVKIANTPIGGRRTESMNRLINRLNEFAS